MSHARAIAVSILNQLDDGRNTLDQLLNQASPQILGLSRPDRALVHALAYGVPRWQGRLDWVIGQLAAKNKKLDPMVRNLLRLGLFQLQFMERIPVSAAVNTTVELAKTNHRAWAAGFINAVLRRYIRQPDQVKFPDEDRQPALFLSVTHAIPLWLIQRWLHRWGKVFTGQLCRAINTVPAVTIRVNTLKTSRQALKDAVALETELSQETSFTPEGISLMHLKRPIPFWEAFKSGWFQVQGEAAQIITHALSPKPGESVWDVCAGLGTKTGHLAQFMNNQGHILATDLYADKLRQLDAEMNRLGVAIVQSRQLDLVKPDKLFRPEKFDRILIDAPCSGLGVLQKNPDGKWRVTADDVQYNGERQLNLLDNAAGHLKSGGVLLYAVCSLEPEENEQVVESFLQKHPDFAIQPLNLKRITAYHQLLTPQGFLKTIPHQHQMDGFFAAKLRSNCT